MLRVGRSVALIKKSLPESSRLVNKPLLMSRVLIYNTILFEFRYDSIFMVSF